MVEATPEDAARRRYFLLMAVCGSVPLMAGIAGYLATNALLWMIIGVAVSSAINMTFLFRLFRKGRAAPVQTNRRP